MRLLIMTDDTKEPVSNRKLIFEMANQLYLAQREIIDLRGQVKLLDLALGNLGAEVADIKAKIR